MITNMTLRIKLIGLAILAIFIVLIVGTVIFSAFSTPKQPSETFLPTPTSVPITPVIFDSSHVTPLQKTTIGQTTDDQLVKNENVVSKTTKGNVTIYKVTSAIPGIDDEIRTQNGRVIFESTNTAISSPTPPKMTSVKRTFGEAEVTQQSVGVGWYTDGYIYPTQGVAFFANSSTGTVYVVQRFTPMTLSNYRSQYGEFLQKKASQPEYFK